MGQGKSEIFAFGWKSKVFAGFFHLPQEFGEKSYFTDFHTPDATHGFGESVQVCKMHDCYRRIRKNFKQYSTPFFPIQVMHAITMDRLDEN